MHKVKRDFLQEISLLIVQEWENSELSCSEFCNRYSFLLTLVYSWLREKRPAMFTTTKNPLFRKSELDYLRNENDELKNILFSLILEKKKFNNIRERG